MPAASVERSSWWEAVGRQLANPSGLGGRIAGQVMLVANRTPTRIAVEALDIQRTDVALDLGCGPGAGVAVLSGLARRVHGVDRSATMIRAAAGRNRHAIAAGRVALACGDFLSLPLADGSIDKVLAANVMYFWNDVPAIIAELKRVVRPGGQIAIYVTDARDMRAWKFASGATHRHFDADGLQSALIAAGLDPTAIRQSSFSFGGVRGLLAVAPLG